jgi:hypothetical protein
MSLNRKLMWKGKKCDSWDFLGDKGGMDYRRMLYIFTLADGRTVKETAERWGVSPSRVYQVRRGFEKALKKIKPVDKITW